VSDIGPGTGAPGEDPPLEEESLSETFWAVARLLRHQTSRALAPWDVAPSHFRALGVLLRHGPMRLSELSDRLKIAPRSATEVVDVLAGRGLAERRPDPDDRRAVLVTLTPEGQRTGAAIRAARVAEGEAFFGALSAQDREAFARILAKLRG
jgi:DNA-binding MarR family transcriptional regulator